MSIQDFINTCDDGCFNLIPNQFTEQAEEGQKYFTVTDEMLKQNLVRIVIEDIADTDAGISFRLRVAGMINADGDLVALRREARGQASNDEWLSGFRTGRLTITQEMIDKGVLSRQDIENLLDHAELWEELGDAMYQDKEYSRKRLFLTTKSTKGLFRFELEERQSPNPDTRHPVVPGVTRPSWRSMHIIGSGVKQQAELGDFEDFDNNHADDVAQVTRRRKPAGSPQQPARRTRSRNR